MVETERQFKVFCVQRPMAGLGFRKDTILAMPNFEWWNLRISPQTMTDSPRKGFYGLPLKSNGFSGINESRLGYLTRNR